MFAPWHSGHGHSGGTARARSGDTAAYTEHTAAYTEHTTIDRGGFTLEQFLVSVQELSLQERFTVVDAAITMLAQLYVHLPLKRAMHGIDPLQRLRLLQQRVLAQRSHHIAAESVNAFMTK